MKNIIIILCAMLLYGRGSESSRMVSIDGTSDPAGRTLIYLWYVEHYPLVNAEGMGGSRGIIDYDWTTNDPRPRFANLHPGVSHTGRHQGNMLYGESVKALSPDGRAVYMNPTVAFLFSGDRLVARYRAEPIDGEVKWNTFCKLPGKDQAEEHTGIREGEKNPYRLAR